MSDTLDIENGILSFTNPNYHLDPSDVNSNPEPIIDSDSSDHTFDELYEELDAVCRFSNKSSIKSRHNYAKLDTVSMGVEPNPDPLTGLENTPLLKSDIENNITSNKTETETLEANNNKYLNSSTLENNMGRRTSSFLDYYINLESAAKQRKETISSLDSGLDCSQNFEARSENSERLCRSSSIENISDSEKENSDSISHVHGEINDDIYAVPLKRKTQKCQEDNHKNNVSNLQNELEKTCETAFSVEELRADEALPSGWERHEDADGPYYWHISSGTIQREPPQSQPGQKLHSKQLIKDVDSINSMPSSKSSSISSSSSDSSEISACNNDHNTESNIKSSQEGTCSLTPDKKPIRFAVRSMGWVEIAEEDLTSERSSKAVNKCIVDLSLGRNDILDVVGRWGDYTRESIVSSDPQTCGMWQGKDLYMDLDDYCLRLTDPQDLTVLNTQPIHTIRVWGVGRDNGRDFAYVARDRVTRKHMCHVFRCDIPARIIANTLRDICKKIMIARSLQQNLAKPVGPVAHNFHNVPCLSGRNIAARPTNLPTEQRRFLHGNSRSSYTSQSFPTPMEEPKKVLKVHYLGTTLVTRALGIEVLNAAIDQLVSVIPYEQYKFVNVAVAPSTITILEPGEDGKQIAECRVRFLSFLGIGRNVKHCAFIMHTAQDQFIAHVFHCEPSSGAMCKTIEAACKLRYQKCLDAHRQIQEKKNAEAQQNKGIATTIRNVFGNLTTRLSKSTDS